MQFSTSRVETSDGLELHVETWRPEPDVVPRFAVCIVHGAAEHVSRYERLAELWTAQGAIVFGADHRGQGRSEGPRGHTPSFEQFARDVRAVLEHQKASLPQSEGPDAIPWFMFGHSMGGLISLIYQLEFRPWADAAMPLRGAIVSAPLIDVAVKVPAWKQILGKVAAKIAPTIPFPSGIEASDVCRDADVVRQYASDPRRADVFSPGWLVAMEAATARVKREAKDIESAMLWYVGTADRLCDHQATLRLFETLTNPKQNDQSIRRWDGYFHELHNEPPELRAPIDNMLTTWLTQRLPT